MSARPPTGPPTGPVADLPILATTGAAFRSVLRDQIRALPRAALVPVLISLLLLLLQVRFGFGSAPVEGETPPPASPLHYLLSLAGAVPYVLFAVSWHRLILLGPERGRPALLPGWRARHWRFLGYMVVIALILFAASLAIGFGNLLGAGLLGLGGESREGGGARSGELVLLLGSLFLALLLGWLLARLSFVLPARAVDERYGLRDSWRQTRGQGLRILATVAIVQVVIAIPTLIVVGLLGTGGGVVGAINEMANAHLLEAAILFVGVLPLLVFGFLASYLSTALGVTVLSIAFRTCSGWRPEPETAPG